MTGKSGLATCADSIVNRKRCGMARLEAGQPRKRRNVVEDPQARVGCFAVA